MLAYNKIKILHPINYLSDKTSKRKNHFSAITYTIFEVTFNTLVKVPNSLVQTGKPCAT